MPNEPWYETVNADHPITQGDLIFNCPILSWKSENLNIQGVNENEVLRGATDAISADVVVMTQACDLEHEKVTNVILCPHLSLSEYCSFWKEDMETKGHKNVSESVLIDRFSSKTAPLRESTEKGSCKKSLYTRLFDASTIYATLTASDRI